MAPLPWRQRLFISDLDGTLLSPARTLGQRTRRVLKRFIADGGLFTVATGRSAGSAASTLGGLELRLDGIAHNGALTTNLTTGEPAAAVALAGPLAGRLFTRALEAGLTPMTYALRGDQTVILHGPLVNDSSAGYLASVSQFHPSFEDDGRGLAALQVLSMIILDQPERLQAFFADECEGRAEVVYTLGHSAYTPGLGVGEVQAGGADKALAAERLAARLGLTAQDVVVFGDNMNDLPLLCWAGAGYCPPGSAAEVLAQVPGRIGSPEEEGVAAFIERILAGDDPGQAT